MTEPEPQVGAGAQPEHELEGTGPTPLPDQSEGLEALLRHATRCRQRYELLLEQAIGSERLRDHVKGWLGEVAGDLVAIAPYLDGPCDLGFP